MHQDAAGRTPLALALELKAPDAVVQMVCTPEVPDNDIVVRVEEESGLCSSQGVSVSVASHCEGLPSIDSPPVPSPLLSSPLPPSARQRAPLCPLASHTLLGLLTPRTAPRRKGSR